MSRTWLSRAWPAALVLALGCKRAPEPEAEQDEPAPCGRVAFVESDAEGRARVQVMAARGGPSAPLSAAPFDAEASVYPVAPSPDGRTLLVLSSRESDDASSRDRLWLADLDGGAKQLRQLDIEIDRQLRSPSWSPDGRWLVLESATHSFRDLYRVEVESGAVLRLTDDPEGNFEPTISPDGQRIAFVSSRDGNAEIYVMSSDGGDPRRLTTSPGDDTEPRWSPDGRTLAFASARERARGVDVFVMSAAGDEQRALVPASSRTESIHASQLEFSPDGSRLAFTELTPRQGSAAIVVVELEGGEIVTRLAGDGIYEQPSWSPDGRFLAFTRGHGGRSAIARARVDTGEVVSLTDDASERWLPRWIADPECPGVTVPVEIPAAAG